MEDIAVITIENPTYPEVLRQISNPPPQLWIRGNLEYDYERSLAVVGTRHCSPYGKEVTEPIVRDLVRCGFTIISGLARGIDTLAHRAALSSYGKTIAVLGGGIDEKSLYPPQNKKLAREIVSTAGAVISEFSPGTEPLAHHFLQRNRIISGLARGVLVIEAPEKSGALSTANHALEQNRDVFAIPGPVFAKNSRGTNMLIKMGARLVGSAEDIFEEFDIDAKETREEVVIAGTEEEKTILRILLDADAGLPVDEIIRSAGLASQNVSSIITIMELDGRIVNLGNGTYSIKR